MNFSLSAPWFTWKRLAGVLVVAVLTLAAGLLSLGTTAPLMHNGVPLPFAMQNKVTGSVTFIGNRNNIPVYDVTFPGSQYTQELSPDRIYLVHIPNDPRVAYVPLNLAITNTSGEHYLNYYGYRYSDPVATMERRDINAFRFRDRFSNQFFASDRARDEDADHDDGLARFEQSRDVTFLPTGNTAGAVYLGPASGLYALVLGDTGSLTITRAEIRGCGNGVIDAGEECDDGNTSNEDICTNACQFYVPTPFGTGATNTGAKLLVRVQALAQTNEASYGTPDIPLLRFDATASGQSVRLTSAMFNAQVGSLQALHNYALWKDTDADGVIDTRVVSNIQPQNSLVQFGTNSWTGAIIPDGDTVRFEVHADVADAPSSNTLQLRLATTQASYVTAKETETDIPLLGIATNTVCTTFACHIGVLTTSSTVWSFTGGSSSSSSSSDSSSSESSSSSSSAPSGPALSVTLKDIGTSQHVSPAQTDVKLLRFEASAPDTSVALEDIVLSAQTGYIGNMENYKVKIDSDGDGNVDTDVPVHVYTQNGRMHLDFVTDSPTGSYTLLGGTLKVFELFADVPADAEASELQIHFFGGQGFIVARHAGQDGARLSGIDLDGDCPVDTCEISAVTVPSIKTFINAGSLFVVQGDVPPSRHLLGGGGAEPIGQIILSAAHEDISVTQIQLTLNGNGADSIARLNILDGTGVPLISYATPENCGDAHVPAGTFCAIVTGDPLIVLKDQTRTLNIYPEIKSDADGGVSGTEVQLSLRGQWLSDETHLLGMVRATGVTTGEELVLSDGDTNDEGEVFIGTSVNVGQNTDIVFGQNTIGLARIASVTNGGEPDGTSIHGGLGQVGAFTFTASENINTANGGHRVALGELHFAIDANNTQLDSAFTLFSGDGSGQMGAACTAVDAQDVPLSGAQFGQFIVRCPNIPSSDIEFQIPQGTSQTYILKGTVTLPQIIISDAATLQATLSNIGNIANHLSANTAFTWFDITDISSTPFYWTEGPDDIQSTLYELPAQ
jgi:cysteine-rich repeat protein